MWPSRLTLHHGLGWRSAQVAAVWLLAIFLAVVPGLVKPVGGELGPWPLPGLSVSGNVYISELDIMPGCTVCAGPNMTAPVPPRSCALAGGGTVIASELLYNAVVGNFTARITWTSDCAGTIGSGEFWASSLIAEYTVTGGTIRVVLEELTGYSYHAVAGFPFQASRSAGFFTVTAIADSLMRVTDALPSVPLVRLRAANIIRVEASGGGGSGAGDECGFYAPPFGEEDAGVISIYANAWGDCAAANRHTVFELLADANGLGSAPLVKATTVLGVGLAAGLYEKVPGPRDPASGFFLWETNTFGETASEAAARAYVAHAGSALLAEAAAFPSNILELMTHDHRAYVLAGQAWEARVGPAYVVPASNPEAEDVTITLVNDCGYSVSVHRVGTDGALVPEVVVGPGPATTRIFVGRPGVNYVVRSYDNVGLLAFRAGEAPMTRTTCDATVHSCTDQSGRCAGWAARGGCRLNPFFMQTACPATCGTCTRTVYHGPDFSAAFWDDFWAKWGGCEASLEVLLRAGLAAGRPCGVAFDEALETALTANECPSPEGNPLAGGPYAALRNAFEIKCTNIRLASAEVVALNRSDAACSAFLDYVVHDYSEETGSSSLLPGGNPCDFACDYAQVVPWQEDSTAAALARLEFLGSSLPAELAGDATFLGACISAYRLAYCSAHDLVAAKTVNAVAGEDVSITAGTQTDRWDPNEWVVCPMGGAIVVDAPTGGSESGSQDLTSKPPTSQSPGASGSGTDGLGAGASGDSDSGAGLFGLGSAGVGVLLVIIGFALAICCTVIIVIYHYSCDRKGLEDLDYT